MLGLIFAWKFPLEFHKVLLLVEHTLYGDEKGELDDVNLFGFFTFFFGEEGFGITDNTDFELFI